VYLNRIQASFFVVLIRSCARVSNPIFVPSFPTISQELFGTEAAVDDDLSGSALEDVVASGMDGFELESIFELVKSIVVGILEIIGLGL
jgi:hypothetical protein